MKSSKFDITYFKFISVSNQIEERIKNALKEYKLTHSQLNVLHLLNNAYPGSLNVKDIKECMVVNQPDITRLIDRLVLKGLVERATCTENRRKVDIILTEEGVEVFKAAHKSCKKAVGNFFADFLDESEAENLYRLLKKLKL